MSVPSLGPEGRQIYKGYEVLSPQKKNVGNGQVFRADGRYRPHPVHWWRPPLVVTERAVGFLATERRTKEEEVGTTRGRTAPIEKTCTFFPILPFSPFSFWSHAVWVALRQVVMLA